MMLTRGEMGYPATNDNDDDLQERVGYRQTIADVLALIEAEQDDILYGSLKTKVEALLN